jgi:hypothetical protein
MMFANSAFGCQQIPVIAVPTDLERFDNLCDRDSFLMSTRTVIHFYGGLAMVHQLSAHTDE